MYNSLPFSGEAHGTGGLSVISPLQILEQCDLSDFDICFVQIGENDVKTAKDDQLGLNNHELMHALINVVNEFHRQGITRVVLSRDGKNQRSTYAKTKTQISCVVTAKLISAFVFATWIVQYLYFLNPKFQASIHPHGPRPSSAVRPVRPWPDHFFGRKLFSRTSFSAKYDFFAGSFFRPNF